MMPTNLTPGVRGLSLDTLLDLIRNEKAYTDRLDTLVKAEKSAQAALDELGIGKAAMEALGAAKTAEAQAAAALGEAKRTAAAMVAEAKSTIDKNFSDARESLSELTSAIENKRRELAAVDGQLTMKTAEYHDALSATSSVKNQLDELKKELESLRSSIGEKRNALASLMSL